MLIFSIRLLVKIVVLATCTKACFLSQKVYYSSTFRNLATGTLSCSLYLATVRRAML
ncbi:hypothetical protein [Cardinium endosymbiont of Tipula unca]|uniref:hypothetical protein n=1 Tax=Cardinium endosymbiont of Tipula unca TaxID=3066216 RepID=UPI0030D2B4BC